MAVSQEPHLEHVTLGLFTAGLCVMSQKVCIRLRVLDTAGEAVGRAAGSRLRFTPCTQKLVLMLVLIRLCRTTR